jgi:hypothetical protein
MSAKQFFKSTAFKCIVVLLSIVLICGIFLTICNSLFYVSDEERLSRAISKLYSGEDVTYETIEVDDKISTTNSTINSVYKITSDNHSGEYLVSSTGEGGYQSGTVTCWIIIGVKDGEIDGIKKVNIASNVNQSFINKNGDSDIQTIIDQQNVASFSSYSTGNLHTGATMSLGAIANSMNGAVSYIKQTVLGAVSKFAEYEYNSLIDETTTISVANGVVTYNIVTASNSPAKSFSITVKVGSDKTITEYTVTTNGSTSSDYANAMYAVSNYVGKSLAELQTLGTSIDNGTIKTGATKSSQLTVNAALFAVANYDKAVEQYA